MKTPAVVAVSIWIMLAGVLTTHAQSITTIYSFNGLSDPNYPTANLTLGPDGRLYGTTSQGGGSEGNGTVFKVTTNGTLTTLVVFNGLNGEIPYASLTLGPDGNFYGTTEAGGEGTVFQMTTNGTLTTLVEFNGGDGANPYAGLTLGLDGNFYGTTYDGGSSDYGTVFRVTTNGSLTTLVNFSDDYGNHGNNPKASLTLGPDGNLYGVTPDGGNNGYGTVFQMTTNGTLTTLVNFGRTNGANPQAALTLGPDGNFYGTTQYGGSSGYGTVFKVTTNGTLTTLVSFNLTNGGAPLASLTLGPEGNFYGTTAGGGSNNNGTVFKLTTNGTLTTLVNFNNTNGANPFAGLTLGPDGNFYGTTQYGGNDNYGTIFRLELSPVPWHPTLSAISNSIGGHFTVYLQSQPNSTNRLWATTNIALDQWQVIATNVTDSNGLTQFLDTNTAGMPQKFYRLSYP